MTNPNDNYVFDATQHAPETKLEPVPAGTYDVTIDDTDVKDIKDNKGWYLAVTFKIASGEYANRKFGNNYNLGHTESAETVRIAHGQLSALCHVTGRFTVTKANKGAELRGAVLRAQVANDGTYNNLKAVFDTAGNGPAKSGSGHAPASVAVASATPGQSWGATAAPAAAPVAVATPSAPVAAPAAPAALPPAGWTAHPTAPGYFYKDQEVLTEADLRARMAPPAAPAAPAVPPAAPTVAAAPAAAPAAWNQAPAAGTPAAPWGNTAPAA